MAKNINASGQYGNSQFTVSQTSVEAGHTTIQAAVNEAISAGGGTIYIYPGTYTESITWPAGISVEGASTGEATFDVIIDGVQTFSAGGNLSFRNISFTNTGAGDTWTSSAPAGVTSNLDFQDCSVTSSAGKAITASAAGIANPMFVYLRSSLVTGTLQGLEGVTRAIFSVDDTTVQTVTANVNTIDLDGNCALISKLSDIRTGLTGTGACVGLNGASVQVDSSNTRYFGGDQPAAAAFKFTVAGANVRTVKDEFYITGATYWAASTGAFGSVSYGSDLIDGGTSSLIDPQITSTIVLEIPKEDPLSWSSHAVSTTVLPTTGSIATAAITLTLPAAPSGGNTCSFIDSTGSLIVSANAGQTIRLGNAISILGGTATSNVIGSVITLIYSSSLGGWVAQNSVGNWLIN